MLLRTEFSRLSRLCWTANGVWLHIYTCLRHFTVQREPVELAYSITKPDNCISNPPPLVILHGIFGNKNNWASLAQRFSKDLNRQIITVDARNHGDSPHHDKMGYHSMAADVSKLLNKLKIKTSHILGHSMGGRTAMVLALNQPELVFSLIIEDTIPAGSAKSGSFPKFIQGLKDIPLNQPGLTYTDSRKAVMQHLEAIVPNAATREILIENLVHDGQDGLIWKFNLDGLHKNIELLCSWPQTQLDGLQFCGHAFFIGAGSSAYCSDGEFIEKDLILQYFPMAETKVLADCGHRIHIDQPDDFCRLIKNHIETLEQ